MKLKYYVFLLVVLSSVSCTFSKSETYINRQEDILEAKQVAFKFYSLIKADQRDSVFQFFKFDTNAPEAVHRNRVRLFIEQSKNVLGKIDSVKFISADTRVIKTGTNLTGQYSLIYEVYRKKIYKERLKLILDDKKIKVAQYDINKQPVSIN